MAAIAYYITGHGFGHARRSVEVIKELLRLRGDLQVYFRTTADAGIFDEIAGPNVHLDRVELDPGAVEKNLFTIDQEGTVAAMRQAIAGRERMVAGELPFLKQNKIELILADIPFIAGDIAEAAGIPIIGITNFTWDWIYEPFLGSHPELLEEVRSSYRKIPTLLKIPFGGRTDWFREVIDIPVIASTPRRSGEEVLKSLQLDQSQARVLVSLRGGISSDSLIAAAKSAREYLFFCTMPVPSGSPKNLLHFPLTSSLTFSDLLSASSVVLSKLGYGIVADCLAARKPIVWPRRWGFREDEVTFEEASPYLTMREMAHDDLFRGKWKTHLERALKTPMPREKLPTNGAAVAARIISERL